MMGIEGLSEIIELAKKEKPKGFFSYLILITTCVILFYSVLHTTGLLYTFKERDIIFCGTVYDYKGSRIKGTRVTLEGLPKLQQITDNEGKFVISAKKSEVKKPATLLFESPEGSKITRHLNWFEGYTAEIDIIIPTPRKGGKNGV